jgi:hypothetical protein
MHVRKLGTKVVRTFQALYGGDESCLHANNHASSTADVLRTLAHGQLLPYIPYPETIHPCSLTQRTVQCLLCLVKALRL